MIKNKKVQQPYWRSSHTAIARKKDRKIRIKQEDDADVVDVAFFDEKEEEEEEEEGHVIKQSADLLLRAQKQCDTTIDGCHPSAAAAAAPQMVL